MGIIDQAAVAAGVHGAGIRDGVSPYSCSCLGPYLQCGNYEWQLQHVYGPSGT